MTHHPHRNPVPGPRRLTLLTRLKLRRAMLDSGRNLNLTVELARAANEASAHRRARLAKGGDGQTAPMSTDFRTDVYTAAAPVDAFSERQYRQLIRMTARTERDPSLRDMIGTRMSRMTTANGYTPPKGRPTPRRPLISTKGRQTKLEVLTGDRWTTLKGVGTPKLAGWGA